VPFEQQPIITAAVECCRFESLSKPKEREFNFKSMFAASMEELPDSVQNRQESTTPLLEQPVAIVAPVQSPAPECCRFESLFKPELKEFDVKAMCTASMEELPQSPQNAKESVAPIQPVPIAAVECCRFESLSKPKERDFDAKAMFGVSIAPNSAACYDFMG
jgi:hypothetical protein